MGCMVGGVRRRRCRREDAPANSPRNWHREREAKQRTHKNNRNTNSNTNSKYEHQWQRNKIRDSCEMNGRTPSEGGKSKKQNNYIHLPHRA